MADLPTPPPPTTTSLYSEETGPTRSGLEPDILYTNLTLLKALKLSMQYSIIFYTFETFVIFLFWLFLFYLFDKIYFATFKLILFTKNGQKLLRVILLQYTWIKLIPLIESRECKDKKVRQL